jgi:hypothetical protein
MIHRAGELRTEPAGEADDAEGWPGFDGNDVVVTATSSGARRCGNDVVERPPARLLLVVTEQPDEARVAETMSVSATCST